MSGDQRRFRDNGETLEHFSDEFIVQCPDCNARCKIMIKSGEVNALMSPRVVACYECGLVKEWHGKSVAKHTDGRDWYFSFPLWLQTPCAGDVLWAFNDKHLTYLQDYFQADVREQRPNVNQSMISRLPSWMKDAKNTKEVLKALQRLRLRLDERH